MIVIGLTGPPGVGKDWVADNVLARHGFYPIGLETVNDLGRLGGEDRTRSLEGWLLVWRARWGVDRVVVTDIKLLGELAWIHRMGGKVLAVKGDRTRPLTLDDEAQQPELKRAIAFADACCWNELGAPVEALEAQVESALRAWGVLTLERGAR